MSDRTNRQQQYFRGVSTDIEVRALMDHFGTPKPGEVLAYEDLEAAMGVEREKSRFRTVLTRYREQMLKLRGVHLHSLPNIGLKALRVDERLDLGIDRAAAGVRRLRESGERLAQLPRNELSETDAKRADTARVLIAKMCGEYDDTRKAIAAPAKSETSPRLMAVAR